MISSKYSPLYGIFLFFFVLGGCHSLKESPNSKDSKQSQGSSISSSSPGNLGQIQAALTLPDEHECDLFIALDANDHPLFEVDIEHARVRNHQYSFLHHLPLGDYHLIGELHCVDPSQSPVVHRSLASEFTVRADEVVEASFRFFYSC